MKSLKLQLFNKDLNFRIYPLNMEEYYTTRFADKYTENYDKLMKDRKYASKVEYKKNLYKEEFSV